jgi:hypothetical protein
MHAIADLWTRIVASSDPLSTPVAVGTAAAAILAVLLPGVWGVTRHLLTLVHEGGHAVAATLTGRRLAGIRLHSDTSGVTVSVGRPRGPGMVVTLLAGYPAAAGLGLGAAWLVDAGRSAALLWVLLGLLALLLVQVRNWFGLWSVLATGAILLAITWLAPVEVHAVFALFLTVLLLAGAPRTVLELQANRLRHGRGTSDADQLARITGLPGLVWVGVFLVFTLGCAAGGAVLLGALPAVLG